MQRYHSERRIFYVSSSSISVCTYVHAFLSICPYTLMVEFKHISQDFWKSFSRNCLCHFALVMRKSYFSYNVHWNLYTIFWSLWFVNTTNASEYSIQFFLSIGRGKGGGGRGACPPTFSGFYIAPPPHFHTKLMVRPPPLWIYFLRLCDIVNSWGKLLFG